MTASTDQRLFDSWYVELFVPAGFNVDIEDLISRITAELRATCTSLNKTLPEHCALRVDQ